MPKSRKSQPASSKKPRTEASPSDPVEIEDVITSEVVEAETSVGTPTSETYVVSDVETALGASSAGEDNFITPLPVVPAPKGKTTKATTPSPNPASRLLDTANLLFAHSPGTIPSNVARGRAAHL